MPRDDGCQGSWRHAAFQNRKSGGLRQETRPLRRQAYQGFRDGRRPEPQIVFFHRRQPFDFAPAFAESTAGRQGGRRALRRTFGAS